MTTWLIITAEDLNDYLVAAQVAAIRAMALADGQADRFAKLMQDRSNYVRNRIAGRSELSATAYSVPPELKTCTCYLIIEALQVAFPVLKLTEDQKITISRAYKDLDIAGTADFPISEPTDAIGTAGSVTSPGPAFYDRDRSATREAMDGI